MRIDFIHQKYVNRKKVYTKKTYTRLKLTYCFKMMFILSRIFT